MKRWIPIVCLLLVSCIDDTPVTNPGTGILATTAPADFDWNMISTVNVRVTGMVTDVPIRNTLQVADKEGTVYVRKWAVMDESTTTPVSMSLRTDSLVVSFGSISKTLPIVNGEVFFDFITLHPEPEFNLDFEPELEP